ncbi:MAG: TonB-dependent receptor [Gemmatimonadota bacterium]|nr:TonB-dependent receptor [Gemmatimonadota bacterium]
MTTIRGMPLSLALLAPLLAAPVVAAQLPDSATIRVMVQAEGVPLADARIQAGTRRALTDQAGRAMLRVAAGRITIRASRIGFRPDSAMLALAAGADTTIVLELGQGEVELEELVVNVTRSNRRVEDQPLRIEVLGQEEIDEKVLMTPGDIAMMLNETGGLRIQNTSPSLGGANIRVQGLRGRYTLLLSDGLPLSGDQASGPGLLQIPPMDLGQVEVLKGAASAFHGSAALGGVINLLSRRPTGQREALLNVTSLGGTDAATWISGIASPEWGWSVFGGWHRQDRNDRDADGWTDVPGYRRGVVRPRVYYEDGRGGSFFATAGATIEEREGGTMAGRLAPDGRPWREETATHRYDAGLVGRMAFGERSFLAVRASGLSQRHDHGYGPALESDRHLTGFLEAAVVHTTGLATWVVGAAWQADQYRSNAAPRFDYDYSVPAAFAQLEFDPTPALALAASARLDHHNVYGTFVSPRLSVLLRPREGWTVRTSGGAGYFGPTPLVEATEVTGLSGVVRPEPLVAERVVGGMVDLGFKVGVFEFNGTVFGSRIRHPVAVVDLSTVDGDEQVLRNQAGPTRTWGGELLGRMHAEGIHLTASYTYLRGTELDPDSPVARREVPLNARHALGVVGMYEWEGTGRIGVELYYTGRQALEDNPYRGESPTYTILGALIERQVGWARLFINFENLTDVRQTATDPLVRPTPGAGGRWTTDAWAPLEGRVVNGGMKISW